MPKALRVSLYIAYPPYIRVSLISFPPSVPSPATPSGKHYKETFFDEDVTLVKNAMVKVTKYINSVTSYRKNQVNMKFFKEFQVKCHSILAIADRYMR